MSWSIIPATEITDEKKRLLQMFNYFNLLIFTFITYFSQTILIFREHIKPANCVVLDQTAFSEAGLSGSALFENASEVGCRI